MSAPIRERSLWARLAVRGLLVVHAAGVRVATALGRRRRAPAPAGLDVLLTGTFYSENWLTAHLGPLTASTRVARVRVVATGSVPALAKVEAVAPPTWLRRILGGVPSRLVTFVWVALRTRPDVVGGFHLLVNGLVALVAARLVGARSLYFCVGGPTEVAGGGWLGENRLFGRTGAEDPWAERQLLAAVAAFDIVVTMGTRARDFFRGHGIASTLHVVPGGVDTTRFVPGNGHRTTDLVLVGRLAPVKRVDLFLRVVQAVARSRPQVTAAVVGDGELRPSLEALARELGVAERVRFVGRTGDVEAWLRVSRVFVLTSDSESLALSLMEAMACGLPAVVTAVGDLDDVVDDGVNGYLVPPGAPDQAAARVLDLLGDESRLAAFTAAAAATARHLTRSEMARRWDAILAPDAGGGAAA